MIDIHLKQSGEALCRPGTMGWDVDRVMTAAARIADLHHYARKNDMNVLVVSGGGNHMRKDDFIRPWTSQGIAVPPSVLARADMIGRWGTVDNSDILSGALDALEVPNIVLLASGMERSDGQTGPSTSNSPENIAEAYAQGKVVFSGGGTGEDNCTTDAAVAELAAGRAQHNKACGLGRIAIALKATTRIDKIYNRDPNDVSSEEPLEAYDHIHAAYMLQHPERFGRVVDSRSQRVLAGFVGGLELRLYNGEKHKPTDAVRKILASESFGTRVLSGPMPEMVRV